MTVVPAEPLLVAPYVTAAEFRASPTWLDTDNLIPSGGAGAQDAELTNVLLRASTWADDRADQRLGATTHTEQMRARINGRGRLSLHPANRPVRDVTALAYGPDPAAVAPLADLSGVWVEDGRQIITHLSGAASAGVRLDFGSAAPGGEVYVRMTYVAGYTSTVLAADTLAAATQITVTDPAGIYAGDVVRIWDPGAEEAATVAAGYQAGDTTVPLTGALAAAHAAGAGVSGVPAGIKQAVILRAMAELLRDDTSSTSSFGGAVVGPGAQRPDGPQAGSLIGQAEDLIASYRRVR